MSEYKGWKLSVRGKGGIFPLVNVRMYCKSCKKRTVWEFITWMEEDEEGDLVEIDDGAIACMEEVFNGVCAKVIPSRKILTDKVDPALETGVIVYITDHNH